MVIIRTPLRIPIAGGGTDLPSYYTKFGSTFISAAINQYIYTTYHRSKFDSKIRLRYSRMEELEHIDDIKNEIIRETLREHNIRDNVELTRQAEIRSGTGVGSSGSFGVGILHAIYPDATKEFLARESTRIQMDVLKYPVGVQDQYAAAYGGANVYKVDKNGLVEVEPINVSGLADKLLLFFTGIKRDANEVLAKSTAKGLDKIQWLAFETREVLEAGNYHRYGEILSEHWEYKKKRGGMTDKNIDIWYNIGIKNGAIGGKLVGAGGGGFLLFYTEDKARLVNAMPLQYIPFKFESGGSKVILND